MGGSVWRALARRIIEEQLAASVHKTDDNKSRSMSDDKTMFFSQVWEKSVGRRRQALAP